MRGTMLHVPGAIIRIAATCVCGSDLWPYRGLEPVTQPRPMGHEYCGTVEEVGSEVKNIKPGQFVIGSFVASDNTCPICRSGQQYSTDWGSLMAATSLASISTIVFFLFVQKYMVQGVVAGAVKG
jgi:threonine dehydrogenase-like Zn-dependent dehydrogenase